MSSDYECGECSSRGLNFLALVALFALVTLVIAYLVAQTLKKKVGEKGKDDASILKVALNYLQMASFAAVVDFRWPEFMRDTLMATSAVSTPRSVVLAADCLLQRSAGKGSRRTPPGCTPPSRPSRLQGPLHPVITTCSLRDAHQSSTSWLININVLVSQSLF